MYKEPNELLADDISRRIAAIDRELDEFQSTFSLLDRTEEDSVRDLLQSKKDIERIYYCWTGPRADHAVFESIDACQMSMVHVSNMADEIRSDLKSEIDRLNRHREDIQDELSRINREGNDKVKVGESGTGEEDDINVG